MPFPWIFWLFGAFIVFCGFTHFLEVVTFGNPIYRFSGLIKLCTAAVSWATVIALVPITPRALAMRSPEELLREIGERKRAEEALLRVQHELEARVAERTAELQNLTDDLQRANRLKDEFLATLAHELRNPLAPIRNALHLLRHNQLAPDGNQLSREMIERQFSSLVRLVDDLLDVSRITRGKVQLQKETSHLGDIIVCAVETAQPLITVAGHHLTVTVPEHPIPIEADPTRLEQVFANLLNNAAKYTEPGGRIDLKVELTGTEVIVHIRDTGVGIPADLLPRVFDLFTQAQGSLDRSQGGLGIGLTLVRQLVELHGGQVTAHSEGPGHGSQFSVRLPLARTDNLGEASRLQPPKTTSPSLPCRILVVDDNTDAAQSLSLLLRMWGHDVRTVHEGASALETATEFQPDVVLLDIGLPGMDGLEVARRLRLQGANVRTLLVAVTGYGQEADRQRSLEAGFDHHLVKPVDPEVLRPLLTAVPDNP